MNIETIVSAVLHDFQLRNANLLLGVDIEFRVLPKSTTWFSQFLIFKYNDTRWVENFCMNKESFFRLSNLLRPVIQKQDTTFRHAIPTTCRLPSHCTSFVREHHFLFAQSNLLLAKAPFVRQFNYSRCLESGECTLVASN
jgi:hypothetical protein